MSISAIIPVYNRREALLSRSLPSVLAQSRPPLEIIVVNDGSTDGLAAKHLPPSDIPIRLLHQTNQGVSAARNTGIRAAAGEWIAFLDSDDEWDPDKLEKQVEYVDNRATNPENLRLCHTAERWIRNGKPVKQPKHLVRSGGWIFDDCLKHCCIGPSSALIHQSVFEEIGTFDENLPVCEDYDLWLRITARIPVLYIDSPLITKYGGHDDQLSHSYAIIDQYRVQALIKSIRDPKTPPPLRQKALAEAETKLNRIIAGAQKRDNIVIERKFTKIHEHLKAR